jgi:hypothetical protein
MNQRNIRSILASVAVALVSAAIALAQATTPPGTQTITIPISPSSHTWQDAQAAGSRGKKVVVITFDQSERRQTCRIESFTADKLVCSRAVGGPRTYLPQQVVALILPGDDRTRIRVFLGLNGGLGAAIWGTVVLAAACPACAVATAFAALVCFEFAGVIAYTDDVPDRLLYLAPGHELSKKLGYVKQ